MEKIDNYRRIVRSLLSDFTYKPTGATYEVELIADPSKDHYEVQRIGFDNEDRHVHGSIIHLDIKDGKIWVQYNGTERSIAEELEEAGIPKSDIVLGFQPPFNRPYTGYATG